MFEGQHVGGKSDVNWIERDYRRIRDAAGELVGGDLGDALYISSFQFQAGFGADGEVAGEFVSAQWVYGADGNAFGQGLSALKIHAQCVMAQDALGQLHFQAAVDKVGLGKMGSVHFFNFPIFRHGDCEFEESGLFDGVIDGGRQPMLVAAEQNMMRGHRFELRLHGFHLGGQRELVEVAVYTGGLAGKFHDA